MLLICLLGMSSLRAANMGIGRANDADVNSWSNDTIKSTKHRVVEPKTKADVHPARYSIAYFCNPDFDRFIDAIPGTYSETREKNYEGINR